MCVCVVSNSGKRLRNDRLIVIIIHTFWFPLLMEKSESKFWDLCIIHIGYPWGWSWFHKSVSHAPLISSARSWLMCMKQSRDHQKIQSVVFIESSLLSCRHKSLPFADSFANQSIWWSYMKLRVCQHGSQSHKFIQFEKSYQFPIPSLPGFPGFHSPAPGLISCFTRSEGARLPPDLACAVGNSAFEAAWDGFPLFPSK